METKTYRSPFAPPLIPASPSEAIRIRVLSSIPDGTLIIKLFCLVNRPLPWQVVQGFLITWPAPPHLLQVCSIAKNLAAS